MYHFEETQHGGKDLGIWWFFLCKKSLGFGWFVSAWKPQQGNNELYVTIELEWYVDYIITFNCIYFLCSEGNSLGRTSITQCFKATRGKQMCNTSQLLAWQFLAALILPIFFFLKRMGILRTECRFVCLCLPSISFSPLIYLNSSEPFLCFLKMQKLLETVNVCQVGFTLWSIGRDLSGTESSDLKQPWRDMDVWQWSEEAESREYWCPLRMEDKNVCWFWFFVLFCEQAG